MTVQKLNSKNQIVIPKEVWQATGVKGGMNCWCWEGCCHPCDAKPKRYAKILHGLAKGLSPGLPEAGTSVVVRVSPLARPSARRCRLLHMNINSDIIPSLTQGSY